MRLDFYEAERNRAKLLPNGLRVLAQNQSYAFILKIWHPKAMKPTINQEFRTMLARAEYATSYVTSFDAASAAKVGRRTDRTSQSSEVDSLADVGAIFSYSWGYDQTNVEYYQVVSRTAKTVKIREIAATSATDVTTGSGMAEYVRPTPDAFISVKIISKRLDFSFGEPKISFEFGNGSLVQVKRFANAEPMVIGKNYRSWYA